MRGIKFPVVKNKRVFFPRKPLCPMCGKRKVHEPHSMAILNAGALRRIDKNHYEMADDGAAIFTLTWHGAHSNTGGQGKDADIFADVAIADLVECGQFDLYFCSTACLRRFFDACVDELERAIGSAKQRNQRAGRKRRNN